MKTLEFPFSNDLLGNFWKVESVKDKNQMLVIWAIKSTLKNYETKPENYLVHLMNSECENSLNKKL